MWALVKFKTLIEDTLENTTLLPKDGAGRNKEFWRQIFIEELARAFDDLLSVKPTKTKDGVFDRCLKVFMAAVSCTVDGRRITARFPRDAYPLITKAIDAYPAKPINSLLTIQQWPGL